MPSPLITLKKREDFLRLRDKEIKAIRPTIMVQAAPSVYKDEAIHIGFTATKKIGNAIIRNYAKRRMRMAAREKVSMQGSPAFDYVLVARKHCVQSPFDALCKDVESALREVHAKL